MGAERVDGGVTDKVAQEEGRCKSRAFIPSRMAVSDGVGDSLRIGTALRIVSRRKQAVYEPKEGVDCDRCDQDEGSREPLAAPMIVGGSSFEVDF